MLVSTRMRVAIVLVAIVTAAAGYRWWNSPKRQITRVLDGVAAALTHDDVESQLQASSAVASLQTYLAPDVLVETGGPSRELRGRRDVIAMAARFRASTPMSRVQFFDPEIQWEGDSAATTHVTVQVVTRQRDGEDVADARHVTIAFTRSEGRWLIASVRVIEEQRSRL